MDSQKSGAPGVIRTRDPRIRSTKNTCNPRLRSSPFRPRTSRKIYTCNGFHFPGVRFPKDSCGFESRMTTKELLKPYLSALMSAVLFETPDFTPAYCWPVMPAVPLIENGLFTTTPAPASPFAPFTSNARVTQSLPQVTQATH